MLVELSSVVAVMHCSVIIDSMGQINCHCQYISSQDFSSFKTNASKQPILTQQSQIAHIFTKIILKSVHSIIEIPLSETNKITYGNGEDCDRRHNCSNGNSFKLTLRYSNRCAYIKDCGVGLGVFIMKKKIIKKAGSCSLLLNVGERWVYINFCIYDAEKSQAGVLEPKEEHSIDLGLEKIVIRKDREGKEYSIRRLDRKEMWLLLGEERRVKAKDFLRMGSEMFEVEGVCSYLEASKVLRRY